ncbi:MAG: hypothetical protein MK212_16515, partial [Saprospiraceae bacterium]|nr:hypothetical protein [Saprospiraceae bacterium]
GYKEEQPATELKMPKEDVATLAKLEDPIQQAVLEHLHLEVNNPKHKRRAKWSISRVLWRAGELKIQEATPYILQLVNNGEAMHKYSAVWALGRCCAKDNSYFENKSADEMVQRAAATSLQMLSKGKERRAFLDAVLAKLPPDFRGAILSQNKGTIGKLIRTFKKSNPSYPAVTLNYLYLLTEDYPTVKKVFVEVIKEISFRAGVFKYVRHIFKAAEQRQDGLVYGILAYLFEKRKHNFKMPKYGSIYHNRRYITPSQELKKPNSQVAYSDQTRAYINRRIVRVLKRLGEAKDSNYVKMATGVLLRYSSSDKTKTRKIKNWRFDRKRKRWKSTTVHFDAYAKCLIMNEILYANSDRYAYDNIHKEWVCKDGFIPGAAVPEKREEGHSELWDAMPQALAHLLIESEAEPVAEFALKALKANKDYAKYESRFDLNLIVRFIQKPFRKLNLYALELARKIYNAQHPQNHLILSMLNSKTKELRDQSLEWIEENRALFFADTEFVKDMMTHSSKPIRDWMKGHLTSIIENLERSKRQILIARIIGQIMHMENTNQNKALIVELAAMLENSFQSDLRYLSLDVVEDLLSHAATEVRIFAANLLREHSIKPDSIPNSIIQRLVNSSSVELVDTGFIILGNCSNMALSKKEELLFKMHTSKSKDIRTRTYPILSRLIETYGDLGKKLVGRYLPMLLRKEPFEGAHENAYGLLTTSLSEHLSGIDRKMIFRLLNSDHVKAQELACLLIERYIPSETLTMRSIIRFADHEILAVRRLAWNIYKNNVGRMKYEREEALRLLDAKWDDSRAFAFEFFRLEFSKEDWTPELLVGICDSVRADVQKFGRELISKYFEDSDGIEYLMKLSQHPRPELQLFATNYLERFATGDLNRLKKLELYFVTVLSQVNKARTAKDRILQFLHKEAMDAFEAAELLAKILDRLSVTVAIGDKATSIEMMRDIHEKYPDIKLPIQFKEIATQV